MNTDEVCVFSMYVYVGMTTISHFLINIFVLSPHKIIMFQLILLFFLCVLNPIWLHTVFCCQMFVMNKEIISASVLTLM